MTKAQYHRLHSYLGLTFGIYFSIIGLTGSILVWHKEIDRLLNPHWYQTAISISVKSPSDYVYEEAINTILNHYSNAEDCSLEWPSPHADNFIAVCNFTDSSFEIFIHPFTGEIIGSRDRDDFGLNKTGFTRLIHLIHTELMFGKTGELINGFLIPFILALLVFGLMLWLPAKRTHLLNAFKIRNAKRTRSFFGELHRKIGFYTSLFLLISALSAIYLIFPVKVDNVMREKPVEQSFDDNLVDTEHGLSSTIKSIFALNNYNEITDIYFYPNELKEYSIYVKDDSNIRPFLGMTVFHISENNLVLEDFSEQPIQNKVLSALFSVHNGEILRTPGRIMLTLIGISPLFFTVTGMYFWMSRIAVQNKSTKKFK